MCVVQGRMSDTNRNLTAKTLLLLGELAKAMGPAFEGVGRPLLSTAVGNISDSKSQVRFGVSLSLLLPRCYYSTIFTYQTMIDGYG